MSRLVSVLALLLIGSSGTAACTSGGSRSQEPPPVHVHEILLPSPTEHELAGLRAGGTKDAPYRMGVGRDVPELQQRVDLASLPWSSGPDRVARSQIRVRSPGARSIRVAVTLESPPEDLRLGYGDGARRVTDIDASDIADRPLPTTPYW